LAKAALSTLDTVKAQLDEAVPVRAQRLTRHEIESIRDLCLLTAKPVLYVANVSERQLLAPDAPVHTVQTLASREGTQAVLLAAALEAEIQQLPAEERQAFLTSAQLEAPGLHQVIRTAYALLGLKTYFTLGPQECRAWTFQQGWKAPQCAGLIHSDFERGFIKAEVMHWGDLLQYGSEAAVRDQGLLRIEGKEYIVQDGDCMHFRFSKS